MQIRDRVRVRADGKRGRIGGIDESRAEERYVVAYDDAPNASDPLPEGVSPGPSAFIGQEHALEPI
jgi:hypothetical protein